jgi:uncharacterized membrane protein YfcA
MSLLALIAVCILTYSFEIVFGLAGTILMLMVMSLMYDTKTLVIFSVLPQILVGTIGLMRSPRNVSLRVLSAMLGFAALGGFAGLYLFYQFSGALFHYLLASAISLFGLYMVLAPGRLRLNRAGERALDVLAGGSQALFGISGPIAMTRMLATFDEKTVVRNYALAFFLALNLFRAAGYLGSGTITPEIGHMMLVSAAPLALALWFSNQLHFRINEQLFRHVVAWVVLLGGVSLFFR